MADNEWRDVVGYEGLYQVSSNGHVRSLRSGKFMMPAPDGSGYPVVTLHRKGQRTERVHVLVCRAFHGPRPSPLHEVAHNDGVRANVAASNLRWATRAENHADMVEHGNALLGEKHPLAKIPDAAVPLILAEYVKGSKTNGCKALAKKYGVTERPIQRIVEGKRRVA